MHPITKTNFGSHGIKVNFHNDTTLTTGYVVKQMGSNKFLVTDGTITAGALVKKIRKLSPTSAIAGDLTNNRSYCTMSVSPAAVGALGATFAITYAVDSATVVNGGTGFTGGDTLTLPGGTGTLTVGTAPGGVIATVSVGIPGVYTPTGAKNNTNGLFTNPVTANKGALTATFTLKYKVISPITVTSGGTGYTAGQPLSFNGQVVGTGGTAPVATVGTVGAGGSVLTVNTTTGSGITRAANGMSQMTGTTEFVRRIWDSKVSTVTPKQYKWSLGGSAGGSAVIDRYS